MSSVWVQLFNLGRPGGVQFMVKEVHCCGSVWRVLFAGDDDWLFFSMRDSDFLFDGMQYMDISIVGDMAPESEFRVVFSDRAKEYIMKNGDN